MVLLCTTQCLALNWEYSVYICCTLNLRVLFCTFMMAYLSMTIIINQDIYVYMFYFYVLCFLVSIFINSSICESPKWSQIPLGKFLFLQRKGLLIFGRN